MTIQIRRPVVVRYPCCGGPMRLTADDLRTRERYHRTCRRCGAAWVVERVRVKGPEVSHGGNELGTRRVVDRLDFREQLRRPEGLAALAWGALGFIGLKARRFARFRRTYA